MSVATLITGGLGSFGSVPLLLLDGLGDFQVNSSAAGGIDWEKWAEPPEGFRRILDTAGIDLRANREALLNQARREIGLLKDEPPPELPREIAAVPIEARIQIPEPEPFDREAFVAELMAQLRGEARAVEQRMATEATRLDQEQREEEDMLMLLAAVI